MPVSIFVRMHVIMRMGRFVSMVMGMPVGMPMRMPVRMPVRMFVVMVIGIGLGQGDRPSGIHHQRLRLQQVSNLSISPICCHLQKIRMVIDAGHLHIGHFGMAAAQPMNNVIHIQQSFVVFGGKANGHKDERRRA